MFFVSLCFGVITAATNNSASQSITVAVAEKTKICHFHTNGLSKVIVVAIVPCGITSLMAIASALLRKAL